MTARSRDHEVIGHHRWRTFGMFWMVLSLLSAVWAISMPVATGPDEPEHFVKAAAVVRGELVGSTSSAGFVVNVPEYVAYTHEQLCTAFKPATSGDCAPPPPSNASGLVADTTTAGTYNPLYYALVGWPTLLLDDTAGLYAMRIVSGILVSGFLALAIMLVGSQKRRTLPLLGLLVVITPMVLYLGGVVNPNSLEIAAILATFTAMMSIVLNPDRRMLTERAWILAVCSIVASNMRMISPLWVAVAVLVPLVLLPRGQLRDFLSQKAVWITAAVIVAGAAASAAWTLLAPSLASGAAAEPGGTASPTEYDNVGSSPAFGVIKMVGLTFDFIQDMIGRMGWYDTVLPIGTYLIWFAFFAAILLAAAAILRGRKAVFAVLLVVAFVAIPAVVQAAYITRGGFIWQARYTLPVFVCLIVGIAMVVNESVRFSDIRMMNRLVLIVSGLWVFNQVAAFLQTLRRYAVGESGSYVAIFRGPDWAPPFGTIAVMTAAIVLIAALGVVFARYARSEGSLK